MRVGEGRLGSQPGTTSVGPSISSDVLIVLNALPIDVDSGDPVLALFARQSIGRLDRDAVDARHQDADLDAIAVLGTAGVAERDGFVVRELRISFADGGAERLQIRESLSEGAVLIASRCFP